MKDKIIEIKSRAEQLLKEWNYPNEHYIEATGMLMVCDELLTALKSESEKPEREVWPCKDSPKNWEEDYQHENGNYVNRCMYCKELFFGHKRRVVCRECQEQQSEPRGEPEIIDEEIEKWARAEGRLYADERIEAAVMLGKIIGAKWMRNKLKE